MYNSIIGRKIPQVDAKNKQIYEGIYAVKYNYNRKVGGVTMFKDMVEEAGYFIDGGSTDTYEEAVDWMDGLKAKQDKWFKGKNKDLIDLNDYSGHKVLDLLDLLILLVKLDGDTSDGDDGVDGELLSLRKQNKSLTEKVYNLVNQIKVLEATKVDAVSCIFVIACVHRSDGRYIEACT